MPIYSHRSDLTETAKSRLKVESAAKKSTLLYYPPSFLPLLYVRTGPIGYNDTDVKPEKVSL